MGRNDRLTRVAVIDPETVVPESTGEDNPVVYGCGEVATV